MQLRTGQLIAPAIALVMLAVLAVQAAMRPTPEDTAPYHGLVKSVYAEYEETGTKFGDWVGVKQLTSGAAYRLLRPNVIFTRVFTHQATGEDVTFLLVHCKDARDIYGHYPPNCYPGQGWKLSESIAFDHQVDTEKVTGTEYHFSMNQIDGRKCIVYNFILLPNGQIARDMSQVSKNAWDYMKRYYGAAQVQVVFGEPECRLEEPRRREILEEMVRAHLPIIKAILYGAERDEQ